MADNDYIGTIQNQRLQQQWSNNMAWSTPSWMQGGFKQGTQTSTARYQPVRAGVQQSWDGGEIRDTRTRPVAARAVNTIGQGLVQRNLNVQEEQAQAQQKEQEAEDFYKSWVNAPNVAKAQALQNQYKNAFKPTSVTPVTPNPILSGYQRGAAAVLKTKLQNQYFNPGPPAPTPFNPTPQQQKAIAGTQQMKASRQPTPAKTPAKTRSQRRSMGQAAIAQIRQSLNNPSIP